MKNDAFVYTDNTRKYAAPKIQGCRYEERRSRYTQMYT